MSYILEALRKSETERKQGGIPDLGSSVQIVHKPRKTRPSLLLWIMVAALLVNAGVLAWLFWPRASAPVVTVEQPRADVSQAAPPQATPEPETVSAAEVPPVSLPPERIGSPEATIDGAGAGDEVWVGTPAGEDVWSPATPAVETPIQKAATESVRSGPAPEPVRTPAVSIVPTLGNMPAGFQRLVPDLVFNSHIYSSNPDARRVMINGQYLREGRTFQNMVVEEITEDGVIFTLQGESFVVSVVRDWNTPR